MRLAVVIGLLAWLTIRFADEQPLPDWRHDELVMAIPKAGMGTDSKFEADLAELFAKHLHVKLRLLRLSPDEALDGLNHGRVHLAAAVRSGSNLALRFSSSYQTLDERAVCSGPLASIDELYARHLAVARDSPQEWALRNARERFDDLRWDPLKGTSAMTLLEQVANNRLDCTVANAEQIATMRNFYPDLEQGLSLHAPSALSWAIAADGDAALLEEADRFFAEITGDHTLHRLIDRHYSYNERLNAVDAATFLGHVRTLLPHYRQWFSDAADLTGLDWRLLAALAYRESHWDPDATSFTNVRGMMMLTEDTADRMGVDNRLDARASIMAGARYLQMLKEQLPLRIAEQDRLWMALAAYNQGMGHLEDARVLAVQSGLNADSWPDVKRTLPLLSRSGYYEQTKFGQARGGEAVILVETVRLYYDLLKRLDEQEAKLAAPRGLGRKLVNLARGKLGLTAPRQ